MDHSHHKRNEFFFFTLKLLKATKIYFLYNFFLLSLSLFGFANRAFSHYTNLNTDPISSCRGFIPSKNKSYRGFIFDMLILLHEMTLNFVACDTSGNCICLK